MAGFSELSDRGKVTRLRRGALEALRQYLVALKRLEFVSNDCHRIFRTEELLRKLLGVPDVISLCR